MNPKTKMKYDDKDIINIKLTEKDVKAKYPTVDLHNIQKNRVCMSTGQLKKIFSINDEEFNNKFLIYCEKELIAKQSKSLDFYDVCVLIDRALIARRKSLASMKFNENINNINNINDTSGNDDERINAIEKRLSELEKKFSELEDQFKAYLVE